MGGFTAFRNHLFNLFPHVFMRKLPAETRFCLIIVDLMQFVAGKVKHTTQAGGLNADDLARSMRRVVESYMTSEEYRATKGVVALFDTTKSVPTNKAGTQKKRDTPATSGKILDEALYTIHSASSPSVVELDSLLQWPLAGETLWRSNNLKFQLYAKMTEELLKIVPQEGLKLIIDDGVAIDHTLYVQRRQEMITDYFFNDRTPYEQECLVSSLSRHHFTERFIVSQAKGVERLAQTGTGEADVKILRFIMYGNNTLRYLIAGPDTDLIFAALLHLKGLVPFKDGLEVWLDTQTASDRGMNASRSYRFINLIALYNAIIEFFEREYPTVKNPIETLVFLCYALETDFTSKFDSSLHVTPALVWNTFSALHTQGDTHYVLFNDHMYDEATVVGTKREATKEKDAAKMGVKRSATPGCPYPLKWWSVLNTAVQYGYDALQDTYEIVLDEIKCQSFFYLVCQFKVLDDLSALGYTQFDKKKGPYRTYIPTSDELFMWTGEIEAKLEAYRLASLNTAQEEETKKRSAQHLMAEADHVTKKPRVTVSLPLPVKRSESTPSVSVVALLDEIEEIKVDEPSLESRTVVPVVPTSVTVKRKMAEMLKKGLPKDYGVPRLNGMLARIYRIQWVMNYHQNGWKTTDYMTNFADTALEDPSLSRHGWKAQEIVQSPESIKRGDFNNSYYTSVFQEGIQPGVIPFKVYEMVESDLVYNRNHAAYLDFGI